ncbi:MAG: TolC family protein [Treponema sp.]|jgi:outer membrane protein TolC|nr:TolC family protein [Treponema sp.]
MMYKPRLKGGILSVLLLALLPLGAVLAQEEIQEKAVRRIDVDEAVALALKNNLSLKSQQVEVGTKKRNSDTSWKSFIPGIQAGASIIGDNEKTTVSGMAPVPYSSEMGAMGIPRSMFETDIPGVGTMYNYVMPYSIDAPRWHIAGQIQVSLNISAAMFEAMKTLRLNYEGGLIGYDKAKIQLERDLRKSYYQMLLVQEQVELLSESFAAAERQVAVAEANYRAGLAPELTLLQAQVSRENMKPQMDQAENGLKMLHAQFAMNLGLPYDTQFELVSAQEETNYIPLDVAELVRKASTGKPDIKELRHNILTLKSSRKAQALALTPGLSLSWNGTSAFIKDPWKDNWFDSSDNWQKGGSFTIALGWKLDSLIPWSTNFQAIKDIDDNITTVNLGLDQLIQGTEIEVYNTVLQLEKTRITAETQQKAIDLAEKSFQLTEEAYRAGLQDLLQVQNAELSLRQARVQMLEQEFNYRNGLIDLEYSIGVPFGTLSSQGGTK